MEICCSCTGTDRLQSCRPEQGHSSTACVAWPLTESSYGLTNIAASKPAKSFIKQHFSTHHKTKQDQHTPVHCRHPTGKTPLNPHSPAPHMHIPTPKQAGTLPQPGPHSLPTATHTHSKQPEHTGLKHMCLTPPHITETPMTSKSQSTAKSE